MTLELNSIIQTACFESDSSIPDTMYGEEIKVQAKLYDPENPQSCVIIIDDKIYHPDDISRLLENANKLKECTVHFN